MTIISEQIRFRTIQAWADELDGTGFSLTFNATKKFTAFISTGKGTDYTPVAGAFAGLWSRNKPQAITINKVGSVTTITVENYNPEEAPTVININDAYGWDAVEESFSTNFRFDRNKLMVQDLTAALTLTTGPSPISNARIYWRFTKTGAHAVTIPSEWKKRDGSIEFGATVIGRTYVFEIVALVFSTGTRFLYDITEV
jgi:hypothetical protein